jgi:hypothetical protein
MAEDLAQSDPNDHRGAALPTEDAQENHAGAGISVREAAALFPIIWTPRFIIIFCLLLAGGLSGANMLTTGSIGTIQQDGC